MRDPGMLRLVLQKNSTVAAIPALQEALIRTGQKTFFAKVDGPENFPRR